MDESDEAEPTLHFTVDAALLRELGERLVGRPHIALAELIKNAYDADATQVDITLRGGVLSVTDNGHGMSLDDFRTRWMRVGTTVKHRQRHSPRLRRSLTGSKGIGRLAVQLLARETVIESVALVNPKSTDGERQPAVRAEILWDEAVQSGDLTSVRVPYTQPNGLVFAGDASHGTRVTLRQLTNEWNARQFEALAQEIWSLRPPYETLRDDFSLNLVTESAGVENAFTRKLDAILSIWNGRVRARLLPEGQPPARVPTMTLPVALPEDTDPEDGRENDPAFDRTSVDASPRQDLVDRFPTRHLLVEVQERDGQRDQFVMTVPHCEVETLTYDIRVFDLQYRQPEGIAVNEARGYLSKFGGVGLYDEGFRLPYYGVDSDWLRIEEDRSARRTVSKLIPKDLDVDRGLLHLPSNRNIFGVVSIATGQEAAARESDGLDAYPGLTVQLTRDRLVVNRAYRQLQVMVRAGVDLYAMQRAREILRRNAARRPSGPSGSPVAAVRDVERVIQQSRDLIPPPVLKQLTNVVRTAATRAEQRESSARAYAALLGALATAGSTSLAYEHEVSKQVQTIRDLSDTVRDIAVTVQDPHTATLLNVAEQMDSWYERVQDVRKVFAPLLTKENRENVKAYGARSTVRRVADQIASIAPGVPVHVDGIPKEMRLPPATYPAWSSMLQNLLINAFNAVRDVKHPIVRVDGAEDTDRGWIRVSDNGVGVELGSAHKLWEPFERRLTLPPEIEAAGLGGMGLGLTIVKMIADELSLQVQFEAPPQGMKTAVRVRWRK